MLEDTKTIESGSRAEDTDSPPFLMPRPIWEILSRRGYRTKEQIENFIQPKLKDLAHPFSLHDMDVAVARLIKAYKTQEKILLYGDYDLDGSPGIALLHDGLTRLGFRNLMVYQPRRLVEGYGVHANLISGFKEQGVNLIVTVDVGITDVNAVEVAQELCIEVIITDHHLPKENLPKALAIVNPNKGTCTSRLQHLCGTGVAFYLILALKIEMSKQQLLHTDFNMKELLDLFALATVTDMVPLIRENRVLVKHGLQQLANSNRPGLKQLFVELGLYKKKLSSQDVAFRIAPKLNALTRLDEDVRALDILMANEMDAERLVQETLLVNQKRRQYQDQAKEIAAQLMQNKNGNKVSAAPDDFVWIYSSEFHPGVISLVASDIMDQQNVPVFVGALNREGQIVGSARAPNKSYNLLHSLNFAAEVLSRFGGHQLAAGFEVSVDKTEKLRELLSKYYQQTAIQAASDEIENPTENLIEISIDELNENFMNWFESLGPFGMGFETPKLQLKKAKVKSLRKLKGNFLKYVLEDVNGVCIEGPWFSKAVSYDVSTYVDVVFQPQWNDFNGRRTIQAIIESMSPTTPSSAFASFYSLKSRE